MNNICFIICTERGRLEQKSTLLVRLLRRFGGRLKDAPVYSFLPRHGHDITPQTKHWFRTHGVHHCSKFLNTHLGRATIASPQSLSGLICDGVAPVLSASTPAEWVESVIRLLDDPTERRRLGHEGRLYVEEFYRWDRALEPLASILRLPDERDRCAVTRWAADERP